MILQYFGPQNTIFLRIFKSFWVGFLHQILGKIEFKVKFVTTCIPATVVFKNTISNVQFSKICQILIPCHCCHLYWWLVMLGYLSEGLLISYFIVHIDNLLFAFWGQFHEWGASTAWSKSLHWIRNFVLFVISLNYMWFFEILYFSKVFHQSGLVEFSLTPFHLGLLHPIWCLPTLR